MIQILAKRTLRSFEGRWRFSSQCGLTALFMSFVAAGGLWPPGVHADSNNAFVDPYPHATAMAARIDHWVEAALVQRQRQPSDRSDDSEFLRRVTLDITGVVPSVPEARAFLTRAPSEATGVETVDRQQDADVSRFRRARLVDRLLESPRHPTHLSTVWRNLILPSELNLQQQLQATRLEDWLRRQFVNNLRYDRLVSSFLSATGEEGAGPAVFYQTLELQPEKLAAATSRIFLSLQIQCAECHDHPFDHWTQRDFWGFAAFFAQLQNDGMRGTMGQDMRLVDLDRGDVTLPDTEEVVLPKFPTEDEPTSIRRGTRRRQLAIWMASADNPFLASAAVNRVWSQLFGRGLVNPVDDMGQHNPASHPQLLEELTRYLIDRNFDLRELYRAIAYSNTYQRTSELSDPSREVVEPTWYSRMPVRRMSAEQLYDSLVLSLQLGQATDAQPNVGIELPPQFRQIDFQRVQFVNAMRSAVPDRTRSDFGVQQALRLMNGAMVSRTTALPEPSVDTSAPQESSDSTDETNEVDSQDDDEDNELADGVSPDAEATIESAEGVVEASGLLAALQAPHWTADDQIEILFLATLSRMPTDLERQRFSEFGVGDSRRWSDMLWVLVNSAEYQLIP